jgi:hypothetical protein
MFDADPGVYFHSDACKKEEHRLLRASAAGQSPVPWSPAYTICRDSHPAGSRLAGHHAGVDAVLEYRANAPKRRPLSVVEAWMAIGDTDEVLPMDAKGNKIGFSRHRPDPKFRSNDHG